MTVVPATVRETIIDQMRLVQEVGRFYKSPAAWEVPSGATYSPGKAYAECLSIILSGLLNPSPKRITSTTYDLLVTDGPLFVDTDGEPIVINIFEGAIGDEFSIANCGSSGNNITVNPNGAQLLYGLNSAVTLIDGESISCLFETTEGWR